METEDKRMRETRRPNKQSARANRRKRHVLCSGGFEFAGATAVAQLSR
jgi:hypothetical protein